VDPAGLNAVRRAVAAAPDDLDLRLHLTVMLIEAGEASEAIGSAAAALQLDPTSERAKALMARALATTPAGPPEAEPPSTSDRFDWERAEQQVGDLADPMFVADAVGPEPDVSAYDVERSTITLADVGGMQDVKARLDAAFLAPLRNPELRRLYGKSLRGGLLLWGPPGCGKTFLARAVAGELGAGFVSIGLTDVLDPYIGNSERNLHEAFQLARRSAPCVLFIDELDALGQRRSMTRNNAMRGTVNQLLTELDGAEADNEGVFVLCATNQPWDVDPALRRPGRLDRTLLVLPPDEKAREAIFRHHLAKRPIEGIDVRKLARSSDLLSGADIAYVCEQAAERALLESAQSGSARLINMADLVEALKGTRPSTTAWLDSARNVALFSDDDGTYKELRSYLKRLKRL
jgi:SpoVK/Ycf46/Vps4 family AAA+-type ATPase